ncbi:MAG TPA: carboxypeptidase-like regulatory domain-containing protein [Streptosporangiaceae bacterium]|nr:carboxypeptidase-like regulatory domain-containing protein [Streptosporangiaceae bacterium]
MRPRLLAIAATCAGLLAAGAVLPGTADATAPAPATAARPATSPAARAVGVIAGEVRSVTGAGLAGVCVAAVAGSAAVPALTETGGRYLITGLVPGRYRLVYGACAQARHYVTSGAPRPVSVVAGRPTLARPVTLRAVGAVGAVPAVPLAIAGLAKGSPAISGTVRNARGKPLAGICVTASEYGAGGVPPSGPGGGAPGGAGTTTNRHGDYTIPAKATSPGPWVVGFTSGCGNKGDYAPQWWKYAATGGKAKVLHIRRGSYFAGIDAKLGPGAAISGVIRAKSKSGPGLKGVCVFAMGLGAAQDDSGLAISGAGGKYLVTGLGSGRYFLDFEPCGPSGNYAQGNYPTPVAVTDGKTTKGIDWYLTLAGEISGSVATAVTPHAPISGVCVLAIGPLSSGIVQISIGEATSGRAGGYSMGGLTPGKYEVEFDPNCGASGSYESQYYDGQSNPELANEFNVAAGQHLTSIDASLEPAGTLTGTVTSATGQDLSGICVLVSPDVQGLGPALADLPPGFAGLAYGGAGVTSARGTYRIKDVIPGNYEVSFAGGCGSPKTSGYAAQWFAPQGGSVPAWLTVGTSVVPNINAALRRGGTIKGVVTNAAGKPVQGICPLAYPTSGEPVSVVAQLYGDVGSGSNRHGSYQFTGLAGGTYAVQYSPCGSAPYATSWYGGNGDQSSARAVSVKDSEVTASVDQRLTAGEEITGRVTAAGGATFKSVCLTLLDSSGNLVTSTSTSASGRYSIRLVAPGSYQLQAGPCDSSTLATVSKGVTVGRSGPATGTNLPLPLAGVIAGQVSGSPADGDAGTIALPGICVTATPVSGSGAPGFAFSAGSGRYKLTGLAPGKYQVTFSSQCPYGPPMYASLTLASPVTVTSSATATASGTQLADGEISGTVTVQGAPAVGVCVLAYPASGGGGPTLAETGKAGGYQVAGLPAGGYAVEFTKGCGAASYQTQWYDGASSRAGATTVTVTYGLLTHGIDAH